MKLSILDEARALTRDGDLESGGVLIDRILEDHTETSAFAALEILDAHYKGTHDNQRVPGGLDRALWDHILAIQEVGSALEAIRRFPRKSTNELVVLVEKAARLNPDSAYLYLGTARTLHHDRERQLLDSLSWAVARYASDWAKLAMVKKYNQNIMNIDKDSYLMALVQLGKRTSTTELLQAIDFDCSSPFNYLLEPHSSVVAVIAVTSDAPAALSYLQLLGQVSTRHNKVKEIRRLIQVILRHGSKKHAQDVLDLGVEIPWLTRLRLRRKAVW